MSFYGSSVLGPIGNYIRHLEPGVRNYSNDMACQNGLPPERSEADSQIQQKLDNLLTMVSS